MKIVTKNALKSEFGLTIMLIFAKLKINKKEKKWKRKRKIKANYQFFTMY